MKVNLKYHISKLIRLYITKQNLVIIGRLFNFGIKFIIPLILVRCFSQSDYGVYQKYITSLLFFTTYFSLGLDQSIIYFVTPKEDKNNVSLFTYNFVVLSWSVLLFGLIQLVHILFPELWYFPETISFSITVALLVFNLSSEFVFIALNKYKSYFVFSLVNSIVRVSLLIAFLLLELSLNSVYRFLLWFEIIKFSWYVVYSLKRTCRLDMKIKLRHIKEVIKYSFTMHLANLIGSTGRGIERYLFLGILSANEFAMYGVAMFRIPFLDIVRGSFGSVLNADLKQGTRTDGSIFTSLAIIVYPSVAFAFINAHQIIEILFTVSYLDVVPLYRLAILSFLLYPILVAPYFQAFNLRKQFLKAEVVTLIFGVFSASILIYFFKLVGGILSFSLLSVFSVLIQLYYLPKKYKKDFMFSNADRTKIKVICLSTFAVFGVNWLFGMSNIIGILSVWLLIPNAIMCVIITVGLNKFFKCVE